MRIAKLFVECRENPIDIGAAPRFSWQLKAEKRGALQTAFQIKVSSSLPKLRSTMPDMWDSGRVASSDTAYVPYAGKALESGCVYWWRVRVWDADGKASRFSRPGRFETALLSAADWTAQWIGLEENPGPAAPVDWEARPKSDIERARAEIRVDPRSVLLRREFHLPARPKRARIYVCGLGLYELRLNGKKVGKNILAPAKTDFRKRVLYDVYDATGLLRQGANAAGIILGNGWYNPPGKAYWDWQMQWFGSPKAILQMHVEYAGGRREIFNSDGSWKAVHGPIIYNCIYDGETYDGRLEHNGWDLPGFDDSGWRSAAIMTPPGGELEPASGVATEIIETVAPRALHKQAPGTLVFDMGKNFAGWARIKVKGQAGTVVKLHFAEDLKKNGSIDPATNLQAKAEDIYILKGGGPETYEPRFTYHGFRGVEVTSEPPLKDKDIRLWGRAISTTCRPVGRFGCSNSFLNRLHKCVRRSQRSCLIMGVPIDCPQRHERLGWLGDAHVTCEEACYNFDMTLFYRKWLRDIRLQQDSEGCLPFISPRLGIECFVPCWSSGYLIVLWQSYIFYGDSDLLREHYPYAVRYVNFVSSQAENYILPQDRYGDWCSPAQGWARGKPELASTAYYYLDVRLLQNMAEQMNRHEEAEKWRELAEKIKVAFYNRFFDAATGAYGDGSQCCQILPLAFGLVPDRHKEKVFELLVRDIVEQHGVHLNVGVLGARHILDVLTDHGRPDLAYQLLLNKGFPGWRDMLTGMTTLSEHWNRAGSHNHVMFGGAASWLYKKLAGIKPDERRPGFGHIRFEPFFAPGLKSAAASLQTLRGKIASSWKRTRAGINLDLAVPAGCRAELRLPASRNIAGRIRERGRDVWHCDTFLPGVPAVISGELRNGSVVFQLLSGRFRFRLESGANREAGDAPAGLTEF